MTQLPNQIASFIGRHHVLTLATTVGDEPHCSNMFYAYISAHNEFVFTSEQHTHHAMQALANPVVAASIVLDTKMVGRIQGLQMRGILTSVEDDSVAREAYLRQYPYALLSELHLWVFEPNWMKLTDNTLGFGKKIIWTKDE